MLDRGTSHGAIGTTSDCEDFAKSFIHRVHAFISRCSSAPASCQAQEAMAAESVPVLEGGVGCGQTIRVGAPGQGCVRNETSLTAFLNYARTLEPQKKLALPPFLFPQCG